MLVLKGKDVATAHREALSQKIEKLKSDQGIVPGLAVVLVGEDPASQVYVRNKGKAAEKVGIKSWTDVLPADTTEDQLKALITKLNNDKNVHGILLQLPLPQHLDSDKAIEWIDPKKDADGLTSENMGLFWAGRPRSIACTPNGVMQILKHYDISVEGKNAVVIGRSVLVGKPMALLLQNANATVTVCHSRTKDVASHTKHADIVVVAAGKPRFLGKDDFKQDSVVIDVGIHRQEGADGKKLCGDVRFEELDGLCKAATPVPGGVGPMTIAMLIENTYNLALASTEN